MILRRPASSITTPSLKGYSVETTFRHSGFAQVVVSVAFSCGRAMVFSPCGEFGLDTLSTSPPIERRTVLFQERGYYPCAAAPDKAERASPYESSPPSTSGPSFFLWGCLLGGQAAYCPFFWSASACPRASICSRRCSSSARIRWASSLVM